MKLWVKEFGPEYEVPSEIEALGWTDISWHNDMCPSFTPDPDDANIRLWVDHPDPAMREYDDQPRFVINRIDTMEAHGYGKSIIIASDDVTEIVAAAERLTPRRIAKWKRGTKDSPRPFFS